MGQDWEWYWWEWDRSGSYACGNGTGAGEKSKSGTVKAVTCKTLLGSTDPSWATSFLVEFVLDPLPYS